MTGHQHLRYVALLRGINVTGRNKIPMADLRAMAEELGWENPETYIQSGNLVFEAHGLPAALESALEAAITRKLALAIPVIVRAAAGWEAYVRGNPFPAAAEARANLLHLGLSKRAPDAGAAAAIQARATQGEQVRVVGDALWIDYPEGVGRSKLTPALLDRLVGSPVTARNFRTVLKLAEMARA